MKRKPTVEKRTIERKKHGPKRHLWHCYEKGVRIILGQCGLLTKYNDRESFNLALMARGIRNPTPDMWKTFCNCADRGSQDVYFASMDRRNKK